ncbi:uncharacterized protein LOC123686368 [Harmonia axyridis]|uniref:uncharacterized protein LOC123686368 n=1 Tax=Harmonia axyridis TaxID=115357 RepID=UPI001E27962C|nr:uncharacterized protein LOC123686368 [Harmonia axyridis]
MSFNHRPLTDTEMCGALKISVCFALVFGTIVSANERVKRSGLIDLGTSVLLPWESSNNGGLNKAFNTILGSEILRGRNIDNQNERNEILQRQRELGMRSNAYNSINQNQAQGAVDSYLIRDTLRQYITDRNVRGGLQQQRGYSGLDAQSLLDSNPSIDEQAWTGRIQNLVQTRNQIGNNQLTQQNSELVDGQSNTQPDVLSLRGQLNRNRKGLIGSNRLNRYRQGLGVELSGANVQQQNSLGSSLPQVGEILRNQGQAREVKQYLVRENPEETEQVDIQQDNQDTTQEVNYRDNSVQSLRPIDNQQLNRPVTQEIISGDNYGQYPLNAAWRSQQQPAEFGDSGLGTNSELVQLQNQEDPNQQVRNSYTYGELSAKIWNVIKSNPSMISNLGNLREQLLNGNNSGNEQMGQLKSLLQEARNRNVFIPRNNVEQSLGEQERNAFVRNLIDAVSKNNGLSIRSNPRAQNVYRGRKA